jgi:hypothetical protein
MKIALPGLCAAVTLLIALDSNAACHCRCVENVERAICDSPQESMARCGQANCPVAPSTIKPPATHRAAVPGTYSCDQMREYSPAMRRYEWTELCVSSSRSSTALVRPGPMPVRTGAQLGASAGSACGTDTDCPSGQTCTRRSMNDPWRCAKR